MLSMGDLARYHETLVGHDNHISMFASFRYSSRLIVPLLLMEKLLTVEKASTEKSTLTFSS